VTGVRGQVEQLVLATEHDLHLLDRGPVTLEPVVDPAADEARAQLGERPMERGALADDRVAMLERDGRGRQLLQAGDLEPRIRAEGHLERARQERLAARALARRAVRSDELLEHAGRCPIADRD
jgi:hypothetical protein